MVAGIFHSLLSAIFCMVPRRILPDRVLGRRLTTVAVLKDGHRADAVAHHLHDLLDDLVVAAGDPGLQHDEADGHLALEVVVHAEDRALGHVLVVGQHLLHGAGGEAVAGHVDDVVGAAP